MSDNQSSGATTIEMLTQQLQDVKSSKREEAIRLLAELNDPAALPLLVNGLKDDRNLNVRLTAAAAVGKVGDASSIGALATILESDPATAIRKAVAAALGSIGEEDAIPALGKALREDKENTVRFAAVESLHQIGTAAAAAMISALDSRLSPSLRGQVIWRLGELKPKEAIPAIEKTLLTDGDDAPARAAATALVQIQGAAAIPRLLEALQKSPNRKVKLRVLEELGALSDATTIPPLCDMLLNGEDAELRTALVDALRKTQGWRTKADQIVVLLKKSSIGRAKVQSIFIYEAISPTKTELAEQPHLLIDYLIGNARGQDGRMTAILAELITASAGNDLALAAARIDNYETTNSLSDKELQPLRLEVGGGEALKPITNMLAEDLVTYFRKPIKELNDQTYSRWNTTIQHGQTGFMSRVIMSIVVFGVGILLVLASGYQLLFAELDSDKLFGPSVSFVGGLATILLIIYTGPLKEISAAVIDLGIANAAFIAFVHRISQISHTYSFQYLKEKISFDDTGKSNILIKEALDDTIKKLSEDRSGSSEGILSRFANKLFGLDKPAGKPAEQPKEKPPLTKPEPSVLTQAKPPADNPQRTAPITNHQQEK